ncbi:transporter substrate-binding domain-containing protein, partial [Zooshikella harenae]
MHKLMAFITLTGSLVLTNLVIAAESVTIIADEDYPPYSYKKDGKMAGIYTDILRAVFDAMPDYKVTIEGVPWKRGLKMMEDSDSFALYPPYKHAGRPYMEYSMPILSEEVAVYCIDKVL